MAILNVFCDESGKFHDKTVISFCGLSASLETLQKFESKWKELLRMHHIESLKMSGALKAHRGLSDVIPKQSTNERSEALKPFAACVGEHLEFGLSMAVNVGAYRRTKQDVKRRVGGGDDPFYFAFLRVILGFANGANGRNISLVCDDDQGTAENCLKLYRKLRNMPDDNLQTLSAITFADDRVFPALQAADMLSGLIRLEAGKRFFEGRNDYGPLLEYMTEDRGRKYTQWGFLFVGEREMAKIELSWAKQLNG